MTNNLHSKEPLKIITTCNCVPLPKIVHRLLSEVFFTLVVGQYDVVNIEEDKHSILDHTAWLMWDAVKAKCLEGRCEVLLTQMMKSTNLLVDFIR